MFESELDKNHTIAATDAIARYAATCRYQKVSLYIIRMLRYFSDDKFVEVVIDISKMYSSNYLVNSRSFAGVYFLIN